MRAEGPEDLVLTQIESALTALGHVTTRVRVAADVEALVAALEAAEPSLVFNMAESFDG